MRATTFRALVADCPDTLHVVARFLALLELYRESAVAFDQVDALGELHVRWTGSDEGELTLDDEFDEPAGRRARTRTVHRDPELDGAVMQTSLTSRHATGTIDLTDALADGRTLPRRTCERARGRRSDAPMRGVAEPARPSRPSCWSSTSRSPRSCSRRCSRSRATTSGPRWRRSRTSYTAPGAASSCARSPAAGGSTRARHTPAVVERFVLDGQQARLTQASLETLAVVAYRQPVSRARVSAVRGVNVDGVMRTLLSRGLVEECGTEPRAARSSTGPRSYFLERLGLGSLEELPPLAPYLPDIESLDIDSVSSSG